MWRPCGLTRPPSLRAAGLARVFRIALGGFLPVELINKIPLAPAKLRPQRGRHRWRKVRRRDTTFTTRPRDPHARASEVVLIAMRSSRAKEAARA